MSSNLISNFINNAKNEKQDQLITMASRICENIYTSNSEAIYMDIWDILISPYNNFSLSPQNNGTFWSISFSDKIISTKMALAKSGKVNSLSIYELIDLKNSKNYNIDNLVPLFCGNGIKNFSLNSYRSKMPSSIPNYILEFKCRNLSYVASTEVRSINKDVDIFNLIKIFDMYANINDATRKSITITLDNKVYITFARVGIQDGVLAIFDIENKVYKFVAHLNTSRIKELKTVYHKHTISPHEDTIII